MSQSKNWLMFGALGLIWGSSFLWIKLALEEIGPFAVVGWRTLFGCLGLVIILWLRRIPLPRDAATLGKFAVMGTLNVALPWLLITWAETRVDSGLAAVLNGAMPLFTTVIAHFALHDDKITAGRALGLIVGFIGVVVLVGAELDLTNFFEGDLIAELALIVAVLLYAISVTFQRRYLRGQNPVLQSTLSLGVGGALVWIATPFFQPYQIPTLPLTWTAVLWLGLLGSCIAFIMSYGLLNAWGPTRSSLVTYVFPVVGLLLGAVFLGETLTWRLAIGAALVIAGIVFVNARTIVAALRPAPAA
ncbi:MAG TPA: DMT family transporter [Anaerolineales bacterium]|nr:DMT family transporter [Anaerolineales bacterium]HRF48550.1 DMT family transporter [Anaerolineales bacterium]